MSPAGDGHNHDAGGGCLSMGAGHASCQDCCCCCRNAGVLPTYEAWTFGKRRPDIPLPPGPGTGKYAMNGTMGNTGYRYGPGRPRAPDSLAHGPFGPYTTVPNIHGPHFSFGERHPEEPNSNPGPGQYRPPISWKAKTSSWGPAPSVRRPMSVPITWEGPYRDTRIPITIKAPFKPLVKDPTPAPHDYQHRDICDCKNCCQNRGPSFGIRHKRSVSASAGPSMCLNTLGAATTCCKTGTWPHL